MSATFTVKSGGLVARTSPVLPLPPYDALAPLAEMRPLAHGMATVTDGKQSFGVFANEALALACRDFLRRGRG